MIDPLPNINLSIIPKNSTIILGLSGGPDSVYLLHALKNIQKDHNITVIAAHLDHQWNDQSKNAANFCKNLCSQLNVNLIVKNSPELKFDPKWNGSKEEQGRKLRRYFFEQVAKQHQASAIALAHHVQDQNETFFIRLLRGSSLTGLTGIAAQDGLYIRPILQLSKQKIYSFLDENCIDYYTDPTNASDDYLRNKIRNHVIPAIKAADSRFETNLQATMKQLQHADDFVNEQAEQAWNNMHNQNGLAIEPFLNLHIVLQHKILLKLLIQNQATCTPSQKFFKEIMRFLHNNKSNKHEIHQSWTMIKEKKYFKIIKKNKTL